MSEYLSPKKKELMEASESYKENIKESLKSIGDTVGKNGKNALVIGGVLVGGYLLYKLLSPSGKSEKKHKKIKKVKSAVPVAVQAESPQVEEHIVYQSSAPSAFEKISERVMEEAMVFLLAMAKEKLAQFMNDDKENGDTK